MSYNIQVIVATPVFTGKQLNVGVSVSGLPGTPGPSFDMDFDGGNIDITGLTTLNNTVTVPSNAIKAHIKLTSSNANENIDTVTNLPSNVPIRFFADSGVTVNFISGTGTNNPRLDGGINCQVHGDYNEWLELTKINGVVCQTNKGIYTT